jgi:hypothetical protein
MKKKAILLPVSFFMFIILGCNAPKNGKENNQKNPASASHTSASNEHNNNAESEGEMRFYELTQSLQEKYEAGKIEEVKSTISEIKSLLPNYENNWNYGNAVHQMNIFAGRIALQQGKVEEAKMYLISAGKTKGSPQLNSFGPNMTLAKELLEKGERGVVIQYFNLCSVFWKGDYGSLTEWKEIVQKGGIPDFGGNLKY